jgi:arylsulfatase
MPSARGYKGPAKFKGGTILFVGVTVEKAQYLDLELLAAGALAFRTGSPERAAGRW